MAKQYILCNDPVCEGAVLADDLEKALKVIEELEAILYADENGSVMKDIIAPLHDKVEKQDKVIEVYEKVVIGAVQDTIHQPDDKLRPVIKSDLQEAQAKVKEIMKDG